MAVDKRKDPKYDKENVIERVNKYLEDKRVEGGVPILKELCLLEDWNYNYLFSLSKKDDDIQEAVDKVLMSKEVALEKGGLEGTLNSRMTELSLKQLGWSDKQEVDITSSDDMLAKVSITALKAALEEDE